MRMNETEKELVAMVLAGRTEAFEPLVSPYRQPLLALAWRLTRDAEDAREIAQEALLRAFRSLGGYDASRSFRNWLFQIAANEARDRYRKRAREKAAFGDVVERAPRDDRVGGRQPGSRKGAGRRSGRTSCARSRSSAPGSARSWSCGTSRSSTSGTRPGRSGVRRSPYASTCPRPAGSCAMSCATIFPIWRKDDDLPQDPSPHAARRR